ncbi:MAG: hypothetical protein AAGA68_08405 [Pseudomonadota bacterium]
MLGSPAFNSGSLEFVQGLAAKRKTEGTAFDANVYVSVGEKETEAMAEIQVLISTLGGNGSAGLKLHALEVVERSGHSEAFPVTAVRSFKWLADLPRSTL